MAQTHTRNNRRRRQRATTYGELLVLLPCCTERHREELTGVLRTAPRPAMAAGRPVPENLNTITYGQLDDLSRVSQEADPAVAVFRILLGIENPVEVYGMPAVDVFGFLNFVRGEVERINKLFDSIAPTRSSEEIAAGVDKLKFGTFGVIDWYARRMGITNQDEVYSVAWVRIYTCMKNDNEQREYEKRLSRQYIDRQRQRQRRTSRPGRRRGNRP